MTDAPDPTVWPKTPDKTGPEKDYAFKDPKENLTDMPEMQSELHLKASFYTELKSMTIELKSMTAELRSMTFELKSMIDELKHEMNRFDDLLSAAELAEVTNTESADNSEFLSARGLDTESDSKSKRSHFSSKSEDGEFFEAVPDLYAPEWVDDESLSGESARRSNAGEKIKQASEKIKQAREKVSQKFGSMYDRMRKPDDIDEDPDMNNSRPESFASRTRKAFRNAGDNMKGWYGEKMFKQLQRLFRAKFQAIIELRPYFLTNMNSPQQSQKT